MSPQGSSARVAFLDPVNISTVVWGSTVLLTKKLAMENVCVWNAASRITNPCAGPTANSTRTTVSFTEPPARPIRESPSCTARNASTKVRHLFDTYCISRLCVICKSIRVWWCAFLRWTSFRKCHFRAEVLVCLVLIICIAKPFYVD